MNRKLVEGAAKVLRLASADSPSDGELRDREEDLYVASGPPCMSTETLHGPIGDWARLVEPHTEAATAALYVSALVALGAVIGRMPHVRLDGSRHGVNLFALLVGPTGTGRKGTAWGRARELLRAVDPGFAAQNVASGLSSGQGVIHHLRDSRPSFGKGQKADPGVPDKRLLVVEPEFAAAIRQMERQANTLSAILRLAWDGASLQTLTKGDSLKASDPHLALIAQITPDELTHCLHPTESLNGFVNRFLFVWTERSKLKPFESDPDDQELQRIVNRVRAAIADARRVERVGLTEAGANWWEAHYPELSDGKPGRLGAALQRATSQIRRLATLFALLDLERTVDEMHLDAALGVWDYASASTTYVLGLERLSARAERLERALLEAGPDGLSLTRMRRHGFGTNSVAAHIIRDTLDELKQAGLACSRCIGLTAGRPKEIWIHAQFKSFLIAVGEKGDKGENGVEGRV